MSNLGLTRFGIWLHWPVAAARVATLTAIAVAAVSGTAAAAGNPDQPTRLELNLLRVAHYPGPVDYSGLFYTQDGVVAVFAYGAPVKIDVWSHGNDGWTKTATLYPNSYGASSGSATSEARFEAMPIGALPANITVPIDGNAFISLAVIAFEAGSWHLVPFDVPGVGAVYAPPGDSVERGDAIVSTLSTCQPDCASGALVSRSWHYSDAAKAFITAQGAGAPPPRQGAAMGYNPASGQLLMFGGNGEHGPLGDTWAWDGAQWHPITATAPPGAGTMFYDDATKQLVLVTHQIGSARAQTLIYTNDTWMPVTNAGGPNSEFDQVAYDSASGQAVMLAGVVGPTVQTWTWDGRVWTQANPAHSPSPAPGEPMTYDPRSKRVILEGSGGVTNHGFGQVDPHPWAWDGADWQRLSPTHLPPASPGGAIAYDPMTQSTWLVNDGGYLDAPCGEGMGSTIDHVYVWNGSDWTLKAAPSPFVARQYAAVAYDPATNQLVDFGGCASPANTNSNVSADTQILHGPQPQQVTTSAVGSQGGSGCDGLSDFGVSASWESKWVRDANTQLQQATTALKGQHGLLIPIGEVKVPGGLYLNWSPHFYMDDASLCAAGVAGGVLRPILTPPGDQMSVSVKAGGSINAVTNTYSADATAWTSAPDAPREENLSTTWLADPKVLSGPQFDLSKAGLDASFTVAQVELAAVKTKFELLVRGSQVLEAQLGPKLVIELDVTKKSLLDELAKNIREAESNAEPGEDPIKLAEQELEDQIAQETSIEVTSFEDGFLRATIAQNTITGDTSIMIEDLTTALDAELSSEVAGLQPGSPDLAEFKSAAEVTPADLAPDAAGLIEGVGGDEVIGGKILCIIIFGGPEDPVGDAVCSAT